MIRVTAQMAYDAPYASVQTGGGDTLEEALIDAIAKANDDDAWKSLDHCGTTYVDVATTEDTDDPWRATTTLLVPEHLTSHAPIPQIRLASQHEALALSVSDATVRLIAPHRGCELRTLKNTPDYAGYKVHVALSEPRPRVHCDGALLQLETVGFDPQYRLCPIVEPAERGHPTPRCALRITRPPGHARDPLAHPIIVEVLAGTPEVIILPAP